jgi:hypothetical protein
VSLKDPSETDNTQREVSVTGNSIGVQCAKAMIEQKVLLDDDHAGSNAMGQSALAPPGGSAQSQYFQQYQQYLQQFQGQSAVPGSVPQPPNAPYGVPPSTQPYMAGMYNPAEASYGGGYSAPTSSPGGAESRQISIASAGAGAVIGKGGSTIARIKQDSGCHISIDQPTPDQPMFRNVSIKGSAQGIQMAMMLIGQLANIC